MHLGSKAVAPTLYTLRKNFVDKHLAFGLRQAQVLLVALPQIHQQANGREPGFLLGAVQMHCTVIEKSGKQLFVAYPTSTFFESPSLSILRAVPLNIASVIAAL